MIPAFNTIRYPRSTSVPIIFWVLTMLSLPFLGWILGEGYLLRGMSFGVLAQSAAVLFILHNAWGWRRTLKTFVTVAVLSYLAEWLGSTTGFPFGKYHYTDLLQPQIAGVPLLIPLAWLMMLAPAWGIAKIIVNHKDTKAQSIFIVVSSLAFTAWDLFLDPQMVNWGFWVWEQPGQYFGIPLVNYFGWMLVSATITLVASPKDLPVGPLALVYVLTWILQTVGQGIFWSQPGPAIVGFFGCGFFVVFAWYKSIKTAQS